MKKLLLYSTVAILLSSCCAQRIPKNQSEPKLQDVVEAVQKQYLLAMKRLADEGISGITITKADLALKVVRKNSANADITVLIFKPSGKYIQTKSSTVTYELSNAAGGAGGAFAQAKNQDLQDMIYSSIKNFNALNNTIGDLTKNNVVLDINFAVEYDASVGLTFKIFGFSTDVGAETNRTVEQDLKLTFMPTSLLPRSPAKN